MVAAVVSRQPIFVFCVVGAIDVKPQIRVGGTVARRPRPHASRVIIFYSVFFNAEIVRE
jgi:hypothetical protein